MTDEGEMKKNNKTKKTFLGLEEIDLNKPIPKKPLLQHDMDQQTQERYDIINKYVADYLEIHLIKRKTENMDLVKKKIMDFKFMVSQKIYKKCFKEFQELEKHIPIQTIDESLCNLPLFTKDDDYNAVHQEFLNCSSFERHLITRLEDKLKFLLFFYDFQFSLCKKNCIESKFYAIQEDIEDCIYQCLSYTHKNIQPSIEAMMDSSVDYYSHTLEHMISKDPKF